MSRSSTTATATQEPQTPLFDTLAVVGVGLLGGSVALGSKRRNIARRVIGVGRNAVRLSEAQTALGLDAVLTDLRRAAEESDALIVALPVDSIADVVREAAIDCRPGAIITDVGSTKARLCHELSSGLPNGVTFIGSHPLAGSEKQGWEHARADLFDRRVCVITPINDSPTTVVERLTEFWVRLGMQVHSMTPDAHDRAVAQTSHVPHVVASALARTLMADNYPFAATGFADTTRIAAGDPNVWVPILLDNADAILTGINEFSTELSVIREALRNRDANSLRELWIRGKAVRESLRIRNSHE